MKKSKTTEPTGRKYNSVRELLIGEKFPKRLIKQFDARVASDTRLDQEVLECVHILTEGNVTKKIVRGMRCSAYKSCPNKKCDAYKKHLYEDWLGARRFCIHLQKLVRCRAVEKNVLLESKRLKKSK